MKKFFICLATTIISLMPTVSQSTIVTKTFWGEVINGSRAGDVATGSFTYDDEQILGASIGWHPYLDGAITIDEGLMVNLSFDGQSFNESHDNEELIVLGFEGLEPKFLDYDLEQGWSGVDFVDSNLTFLGSGSLLSGSPGILPYTGTEGFDFEILLEAEYSPVPIPTAFWLLFSGVAGLVAYRKK